MEQAYRLCEKEQKETCGHDSAQRYLANHASRFHRIQNVCRELFPHRDTPLLDIGRSGLTAELAQYYENMTTLGFPLTHDRGGHREIESLTLPHIEYDLRKCEDPETWPVEKRDSFAGIVCSEVLEHLPIAPEYFLLFLATLLKPGGLLLLTTPNRADIRSRIRLLMGRNPEGVIRLYSDNPGHFREYTRKELIHMGNRALLHPRRVVSCNFTPLRGDIFAPVRIFPPFKDSLIALYEKKDVRR